MTGFARLIDLLIEFWRDLLPWFIINSFEQAIILRLGAGKLMSPGGNPYHRIVGPGMHWRIPFVDQPIIYDGRPQMADYEVETFISKDKTAYLCQFHMLHRLDDIVICVLDVKDATAALADAIAGTMRRAIKSSSDSELDDDQLEQRLTEKARARAKKFGVYVERVYISELAPMGLSRGVLRIGGSRNCEHGG